MTKYYQRVVELVMDETNNGHWDGGAFTQP